MNDDEKLALAKKLALQLRELAESCEKAATGDLAAKRHLADHLDGYWHALVVGGREVEYLIHNDEPEWPVE